MLIIRPHVCSRASIVHENSLEWTYALSMPCTPHMRRRSVVTIYWSSRPPKIMVQVERHRVELPIKCFSRCISIAVVTTISLQAMVVL
jgi:hypothetical protein